MADEQGCLEWLEPRRAQGVHDLMVRLLGKCTCEDMPAEVIELYVVDGARSAGRMVERPLRDRGRVKCSTCDETPESVVIGSGGVCVCVECYADGLDRLSV